MISCDALSSSPTGAILYAARNAASETDIPFEFAGENLPSKGSTNLSGREKYRADFWRRNSNFQRSMYFQSKEEGGGCPYGQSSG